MKSERNQTIALSEAELERYNRRLLHVNRCMMLEEVVNRTIHQDSFDVLPFLPKRFVDLLFLDPPYNLNKQFGSTVFKETSLDEYIAWFASWFPSLLDVLKPNASVYICGDWRSSTAVHLVVSKYLKVRNRITWEREKGRGAQRNWKNCTEDIWFCTVSDDYLFNVDAVKLRRRVIAPYKTEKGTPKDWQETSEGNFRLTAPSNIWTDLTVPFWSMPENTEHPTQKPEKLLAKVILASTEANSFVFDPFGGSGTTAVVAQKLGRHYLSIEKDKLYCCLTEKRLELAKQFPQIQGYSDGVFWERNSNFAKASQRNVKREDSLFQESEENVGNESTF